MRLQQSQLAISSVCSFVAGKDVHKARLKLPEQQPICLFWPSCHCGGKTNNCFIFAVVTA